MDLLTVTFLIIACYLIYAYFKKKLNYFEDLGVPYVPPVPIFGNMTKILLALRHSHDSIRYFYNYNSEAKYIGIFDFMRPIILVRDPEIIKNITIKHFDNFTDHLALVDPKLDPLFANNLFSLKGDKWRETRNLLGPAFTSSKMKAMYELMIPIAQNLIQHVDSLVEENPKNVCSTKDLFSRYTNDVVASCAFGWGIDSFGEPNNEFFVTVKNSLNIQGWLAIKFLLARATPKLVKIFGIQLFPDHVTKFFEDIVRKTIKMREEKGITRPDMIQLMIDAKDKDNKNLKFDITEMTAQAFVFFLAGFDTSTNQMCAIAHELTLNQDIQKRLQEEIDEVMKKTDGKPTYYAITSMPYLDAVFFETLRKHSQAFILDRECVKSYELPPSLPGAKAMTVKPGTIVWIPTAGIQYDEKFFDNPTKFDPDRYLNKKVTFNQVETLGFGIGPRSCIGSRFAILETKILIFHLLAKFNLKPNAKTCDPYVYNTKGIAPSPPGGFWLTFEPRNKRTL